MQRASIASVCPYCGVACGLRVSTQEGKITGLDYMTGHPVNQGALCARGNDSLELVYHHERLLYPMQREDGDLKRVSWSEALTTVAANLHRIQAESGADALGFLVSARATNEENYLLQKLARMLGTNNIDHPARFFHHPTTAGLTATLGSGAMTNPIVDLANADCILAIGTNFADTQPIVARWVLDAVGRGGTLIVVDPRYTPTAWSADLFLPLLPGTDALLINAMLHVIIAEGLHKPQFVEARVEGFEALRRKVAHYPPSRAAGETGLSEADIVRAARVYATARAASIVYGMGVTRQASGPGTVENLANLALLAGQIGRPGTGVNPLRGQGNVQGACDMGALPDAFPGYQPVTERANREQFARAYGVEPDALSPNPGLTLPEMTAAIHAGKLRGMLVLGENPLSGEPGAAQAIATLKELDFLAVLEILPSEATALADVVLPGVSFAEKRGTRTATDRRVQWLEQAVEPVGEAVSDWKILCRLAARLGFEKAFTYPHEEAVFYEIRAMVSTYSGLSPERLQQSPGGIPWPCLASDHPGTPILYTDSFHRPGGKARMVPVEPLPPTEAPSKDYPLLLAGGRTVPGTTPRSARAPEPLVQINPDTAEQYGLREQATVEVATRRGQAQASVRLSRSIACGMAFMPHHFPAASLLADEALDPAAGMPEYRAAPCRIRAVGRPARAGRPAKKGGAHA